MRERAEEGERDGYGCVAAVKRGKYGCVIAGMVAGESGCVPCEQNSGGGLDSENDLNYFLCFLFFNQIGILLRLLEFIDFMASHLVKYIFSAQIASYCWRCSNVSTNAVLSYTNISPRVPPNPSVYRTLFVLPPLIPSLLHERNPTPPFYYPIPLSLSSPTTRSPLSRSPEIIAKFIT